MSKQACVDLGSNPVSEDFTNISLHDEEKKKKKEPRRILHFSDGILEEYSTDEDEEEAIAEPRIDPKTLKWLPWFWYYIATISKKSLAVADSCGESLAWFFGITTPKYQYAIDEYYRMKEEEEREKQSEERRKQRLEEEKLSHIEVDNNLPDDEKEKNLQDIPTCNISDIHTEKF